MFSMSVVTRNGRPIEVTGQVVGGRAILRLKDISGVKRELKFNATTGEEIPASGR